MLYDIDCKFQTVYILHKSKVITKIFQITVSGKVILVPPQNHFIGDCDIIIFRKYQKFYRKEEKNEKSETNARQEMFTCFAGSHHGNAYD